MAVSGGREVGSSLGGGGGRGGTETAVHRIVTVSVFMSKNADGLVPWAGNGTYVWVGIYRTTVCAYGL